MEVIDYPTHSQRELSVTDWLITLLITSIPLVGIIMLFVWAFGDNTPKSKANWAKANLLLMVIALGIAALFFAFFGMGALMMSDS